MIHHRSAREVRRFDVIKLIVLIILIILLLLIWLFRPFETSIVSTETAPGEQTAVEAAQVTETESPSAVEPDAAPTETRVAPPTIDPLQTEALSGKEVILTGTGEANSDVEILVDGEVVGVAPIDSDGNWSFTLPALDPGDYDIRVRSLGTDGQVLAESEIRSFTWPDVDIISPEVVSPASGTEISGQTTLRGTGVPDSKVEIVVDDRVIGTESVNSEGNWTFDLTLTHVGTYLVSVRTVGAEELQPASEPVVVTVTDTGAGEAAPPTETTGQESAAPETTTQERDTTTTEPFEPSGADGLLDIIFPADGADILVGQLTVTGSGPSGGDVEVLDGETVLGTAQIGSDDEWRFTLEVVSGSLQLAARLSGSRASPTDFVDVRVVESSESYDCASNPGLDRGATYLVGTCDTLAEIARRAGLAFADLAAANPQVDDPDLIYPGEVIAIPGR